MFNFFKSTFIAVFLLILLSQISYSQDTSAVIDTTSNWFFLNRINLNLNESYNKNWAKDNAINSFILNTYYLGNINYLTKDFKWQNTIDLGFGLNLQNFKPQNILQYKSEDRLKLSSSVSYKMKNDFNYNFNLDFASQFTDGFSGDALYTSFLSPAYLTASIGLNYIKKHYTVLFSILSVKSTFVTDKRITSFSSSNNLGAYFKWTSTAFEIAKNISLDTKWEIFYDYSKTWRNMTSDITLNFNLKVNSWLSATIFGEFLYDDTFSKNLQIKQNLGIMTTIKFHNDDEIATRMKIKNL